MFQNGQFYKNIEKMFTTLYIANTERINLLYIRVLDERFKRDPTLTIEKNIDIFNSGQNRIETMEKRRTLRKAIKKREKKKENKDDSNIQSYKRYNVKKDFESALNNEIKKAKEQMLVKRRSERANIPKVSEEEDDEDTKKLIKEVQKNRPKKFFRNTDDDNETE
jgi:hypothetical protein